MGAKVVGAYCGSMIAPPKPLGAVRLVCQSDTHSRVEGLLKPIPDGDIYVHAGDFTSTGTLKELVAFESYVAALPHPHKIVIAGNHDITLHREYYTTRGGRRFHGKWKMQDVDVCRAVLAESENLTYLEDSGTTVMGLTFWGSPWQPAFCDWAFNLERGSPEIREVWSRIPARVDVLLTHGPPRGHGGKTAQFVDEGCADLLDAVRARDIALHVFGHIHEAYGVTRDERTTFVNASTCTLAYRPTNSAVVIDVMPSAVAGMMAEEVVVD